MIQPRLVAAFQVLDLITLVWVLSITQGSISGEYNPLATMVYSYAGASGLVAFKSIFGIVTVLAVVRLGAPKGEGPFKGNYWFYPSILILVGLLGSLSNTLSALILLGWIHL